MRLPVYSRFFSATLPARSHVGSLPIPYPPSVSLALSHPDTPASALPSPPSASRSLASSSLSFSSSVPSGSPATLVVTGPRGSLVVDLKPFVSLRLAPPPSHPDLAPAGNLLPSLVVAVADPALKHQRAVWGLTRSLIANAVRGVSEGYSLPLRLVGVGYRAAIELVSPTATSPSPAAQRLNLKLGYAHPVLVDLPADVHAATPSSTTIVLSGTDKQRLGEVAARIRRWRVPEPYNGKGIFVGGEVVRRKEVKKK